MFLDLILQIETFLPELSETLHIKLLESVRAIHLVRSVDDQRDNIVATFLQGVPPRHYVTIDIVQI